MGLGILLVFGVSVLSSVIVFVSIYNRIVQRRNAVERGWADVITQERQKGNIMPKIESVVNDHKEFESTLLNQIVSLRSQVAELDDKKVDTELLQNIEKSMKEVKAGFNATLEAYPDLKSAELMGQLMQEWAEQEENVGAALRIFNQNVEAFNTGIQVFPDNIVNVLLNKEAAYNPFSDSESSKSFEYKLENRNEEEQKS